MKKKGCVYMYNRITVLYSRNYHNIVINLYVSKTLKNEKKNALPQDKHHSSKE